MYIGRATAHGIGARPVHTDVGDRLGRVSRRLVTGEREVSSRIIGEEVMRQLRELDEVAYVRFASVYRSFQDLSEFQDELNRLTAKKPAPVAK